MDNQKKYSNNHGRKPKTDKMRHRYVFRLDDEDTSHTFVPRPRVSG